MEKEKVLSNKDLQEMFDLNEEEAGQLITDVNDYIRSGGSITIKNHVLTSHLIQALGVKNNYLSWLEELEG